MTNERFIGRLGLAARRLALYADECALILQKNGFPGKAASLQRKAAEVMDALPKKRPEAVSESCRR